MLVLLGVLVVVAGFATRRNPLLVVGVAGIVTGLLGGLSPREVLAAFGTGFANSRGVTIFAVTLPVIGLLEHHGLQEQARRLVARFASLTAGRFLALYLLLRQVTSAVGLGGVLGHAQTVRPLAAPMAEAAAERAHGPLPDRVRERIRSFAASADNVGFFFGEDVFLAVGSILLITGFVNTTYHTRLEPLELALWAIPTAVCALAVHGWRLLRLDRSLLAAEPVRRRDGPEGGREVIRAEWFFWLVGGLFLVMAAQMLTDRSNPRRRGSALFWGLLGLGFVYGTWVADHRAPAEPLGAAVLVMVCLAGFGRTGRGAPPADAAERRAAGAERFGGRLFVPALTIPAVALACAVGLKKVHWDGGPLLQKGSETVLGLGIGSVVALVVGMVMLREKRLATPLHAGRSMLESMGWAMLLPQLLATLGAIFAAAGVGDQVRRVTTAVLPDGSVFLAVVVYCAGMFLFTVVMGNGFAAFPVMTAAVGWPVLVEQAHGNAPAVLAVGMLAGFCGTLVTPMAANYNLVPAALLELSDQYGPIKAQLPTAFILLACNIAVMFLFAV